VFGPEVFLFTRAAQKIAAHWRASQYPAFDDRAYVEFGGLLTWLGLG